MATGPSTAREVRKLVDAVRDVCRRLDPDLIGLYEVPQVFDALVAVERLAGGGVVRMSARYEEAGEWKRNGAKTPEDDLARKTGTGTGQARRRLAASKRLGGQAKTDAAVRNGELSPDQADAVSSGAAASPDDEDDLLASARKDPLHELRRKTAAAKARADADREATRRRLHAQRSMRRWNDDDGMGNLLLRLPADEMAEIDAALKRPIDRRFPDARDAAVSVSAVRALMCDAFLSVVFKKGVDVLNVTHLGRQVTAAQRTALEARGGACARCGGTYLLDIDHTEDWTLTHATRVEDLAWACWHCHHLKTRHDLIFTGPPGNRELAHRDGTPWRGPPDTTPGTEHGTEPGPAAAPVQDDLFTLAT